MAAGPRPTNMFQGAGADRVGQAMAFLQKFRPDLFNPATADLGIGLKPIQEDALNLIRQFNPGALPTPQVPQTGGGFPTVPQTGGGFPVPTEIPRQQPPMEIPRQQPIPGQTPPILPRQEPIPGQTPPIGIPSTGFGSTRNLQMNALNNRRKRVFGNEPIKGTFSRG